MTSLFQRRLPLLHRLTLGASTSSMSRCHAGSGTSAPALEPLPSPCACYGSVRRCRLWEPLPKPLPTSDTACFGRVMDFWPAGLSVALIAVPPDSRNRIVPAPRSDDCRRFCSDAVCRSSFLSWVPRSPPRSPRSKRGDRAAAKNRNHCHVRLWQTAPS